MMARQELGLTTEEVEDGVERVYMTVSSNGAGESIYTIVGPAGERIPLVAIDDKGVAILRQFAQESAAASGQTVSIICFTTRSHYETFRRGTTGDTTS